ncbi:hypothetical protein P692DRAFT_201805683 [Suillus brevipes Sb2]|nr:hypothetical protein P692DRAFT_201805683 [Suillus brevipes Sb2]
MSAISIFFNLPFHFVARSFNLPRTPWHLRALFSVSLASKMLNLTCWTSEGEWLQIMDMTPVVWVIQTAAQNDLTVRKIRSAKMVKASLQQSQCLLLGLKKKEPRPGLTTTASVTNRESQFVYSWTDFELHVQLSAFTVHHCTINAIDALREACNAVLRVGPDIDRQVEDA